jgi:hypothetical protein
MVNARACLPARIIDLDVIVLEIRVVGTVGVAATHYRLI